MAQEYKQTLNLPRTDFPMRADLPQREPEILRRWDEMGIYQRVLEKNRGGPRFILHDGPPFANGDVHLGTAMNKVLKDIVVKFRTMQGYDSPYIPGWDTHGLAIEQTVLKQEGADYRSLEPLEWRRRCRDLALHFASVQKEQFRRLGVRGDWDHSYMTLDAEYEARELEVFRRLVEKGLIYRGLKPVHWCWSCETSLAEAEIEYEDHESPSLYVGFPAREGLPSPFAEEADGKAEVLIWTTTPWTLPGNTGVAVHPAGEYALVGADGRRFLLARNLVGKVAEELGWKQVTTLAVGPGSALEGVLLAHPIFDDRVSRMVLADYVSLEEGTGCVHTAPGHGREDFMTGQEYGLPTVSPLDGRGVFTEEAGPFAGQFCYDANPRIVEFLRRKGLLLRAGSVHHQYPHCWRCKRPVIYRALEQWFMNIDAIRTDLLDATGEVRWYPEGSNLRMRGMLESSPDWCLSRQRVWGVPIPAFLCKACGAALLASVAVGRVVEVVRREGTDAWWSKSPQELLGDACRCPQCGSTGLAKEMDTLSPWFDSGSSHYAVCAPNPILGLPVDIYLEGSDQHRGWFQSALVTALPALGYAPYRGVVTHGFIVDEAGRKISKSRMDATSPDVILAQYGADVLRFWVSALDFGRDVRVSEDILRQVAEGYRRVRNTVRFMLSNLYDLEAEDLVPSEKLPEIDRWALSRLQDLVAKATEAYASYRFHLAYREVQNFCANDLSAFYLDVLKDRLYTYPANSEGRRAAQTALLTIVSALLRLVAPVLTFTAEEAYAHLPAFARQQASIQLEPWPQVDPALVDDELENRWEELFRVRDKAMKALEQAKEQGTISQFLESKLHILCPPETADALAALGEHLNAFFVVSQVEVEPVAVEGEDTTVSVLPPEGAKCARCLLVAVTVGDNAEHPALCSRCVQAVVAAEQ